MEALTHEAVHAAAALLRRRKVQFDEMRKDDADGGAAAGAEESLALLSGDFARGILWNLIELGIVE